MPGPGIGAPAHLPQGPVGETPHRQGTWHPVGGGAEILASSLPGSGRSYWRLPMARTHGSSPGGSSSSSTSPSAPDSTSPTALWCDFPAASTYSYSLLPGHPAAPGSPGRRRTGDHKSEETRAEPRPGATSMRQCGPDIHLRDRPACVFSLVLLPPVSCAGPSPRWRPWARFIRIVPGRAVVGPAAATELRAPGGPGAAPHSRGDRPGVPGPGNCGRSLGGRP